MRILITGALGHIGSRLIRELPFSFQGAEIVLLDNLATQRYCSLFQLPEEGRYHFLQADVMRCDLDSLLEGADAVIHLAAMTDPAESFRTKKLVEWINVGGTERMARACLKAGSPMIFISTTSVYGKPSGMVDEDCPSSDLKPQSPYADSKLKAERSLQRMGQEGLRFVICRFGTVFGASPGMRFHTAVNKFCWQAVMDQPLSVWRNALDQSRPYLELGDAVRAIEFVLERSLFDGKIYNVLTTNTTVRAVLDVLLSFVPGVRLKYVDQEGMNSFSCQVSNSRLVSKGFQFQGSLREGIGGIVQLLQSSSSYASSSHRVSL